MCMKGGTRSLVCEEGSGRLVQPPGLAWGLAGGMHGQQATLLLDSSLNVCPAISPPKNP